MASDGCEALRADDIRKWGVGGWGFFFFVAFCFFFFVFLFFFCFGVLGFFLFCFVFGFFFFFYLFIRRCQLAPKGTSRDLILVVGIASNGEQILPKQSAR